MTSDDPYDRFRHSRNCGHKTGTSVPATCGKPPTHWVVRCPFNVNGLACNAHANEAKRHLYAVSPILEES